MSPINIDKNLANKLDQGMRSGEAIELPFPVVYIWALNGQASYKSQGGALYYGGWACKVEHLDAMVEALSLPVPSGWKAYTIGSRDGGEFDAYVSRSVLVAPFGKRISWTGRDGRRSAVYIEGGRRHVQVLAYMADSRGENGTRVIEPWGPVVLTAKGYQAGNLLDAFSAWDKATSSLRRKVAPGVPAWCFYLAVGTFGKERQSENVGKAGAQSPITPITAFIPQDMNEQRMESLFVGEDVVASMVDYQDQAQEWLTAWKTGGETQGQLSTDEYGQGPQPPDNWPVEDEIPF